MVCTLVSERDSLDDRELRMSQIAHAGRSRKRPAEWQRALVRGLLALDWRSIAAFGLPFLLYLWTMAPTIYNLDSAELTTAAATGGITRATGYPLYLLLGRIWSLL